MRRLVPPDQITDVTIAQLRAVADAAEKKQIELEQIEIIINAKQLSELKKRKLVDVKQWKTFRLTRGPRFALERPKLATELRPRCWRTVRGLRRHLKSSIGRPWDAVRGAGICTRC